MQAAPTHAGHVGPAEDGRATTVVHVGGLHYASEKAVVERALGNRPGVTAVEANPVAQTATVEFDPALTTVAELRQWVEECGYHCAGRSVPGHVCDPLAQEEPLAPALDHAAVERADDAHGHGHGGHAGMSMAAMAADMRNRFLVAALFAIPIALWSPLGEFLFASTPPTPFGIGDDLWQFFPSLPVIFYASWIFFRCAYIALRARTLDMMVLVAVAIGTGWVYSVAATFWIEGDVFYEAAAFLATFVLLGHWFEMRARGGANDAIRALLDGNRRLLEREGVSLDGLGPRADELAGAGRTVVHVAVDGSLAGLIAIADAPARPRSRPSPHSRNSASAPSCSRATTVRRPSASRPSLGSMRSWLRCFPPTRRPRWQSCRPKAAQWRWWATV